MTSEDRGEAALAWLCDRDLTAPNGPPNGAETIFTPVFKHARSPHHPSASKRKVIQKTKNVRRSFSQKHQNTMAKTLKNRHVFVN